MSQYTIKIMGEDSLLQRSEPIKQIDESLAPLVQLLKLAQEGKGGVGIAAPQIGVNQRIIVFGFEKSVRYPNEKPVPHTVLINPEYEPCSDEKEFGWEGCLSVPGMRGLVPRYKKIKYWGHDEQGKFIERTAENFHARMIQHEVDHLDGILFPFRIEDLKDFGFESVIFKRIYGREGA